jgi:exodeoxyribonuclease III
MRTRARERNSGWRLDYFIVTPDLLPFLKNATIRMDVQGSDHAPVLLEMK